MQARREGLEAGVDCFCSSKTGLNRFLGEEEGEASLIENSTGGWSRGAGPCAVMGLERGAGPCAVMGLVCALL